MDTWQVKRIATGSPYNNIIVVSEDLAELARTGAPADLLMVRHALPLLLASHVLLALRASVPECASERGRHFVRKHCQHADAPICLVPGYLFL